MVFIVTTCFLYILTITSRLSLFSYSLFLLLLLLLISHTASVSSPLPLSSSFLYILTASYILLSFYFIFSILTSLVVSPSPPLHLYLTFPPFSLSSLSTVCPCLSLSIFFLHLPLPQIYPSHLFLLPSNIPFYTSFNFFSPFSLFILLVFLLHSSTFHPLPSSLPPSPFFTFTSSYISKHPATTLPTVFSSF